MGTLEGCSSTPGPVRGSARGLNAARAKGVQSIATPCGAHYAGAGGPVPRDGGVPATGRGPNRGRLRGA